MILDRNTRNKKKCVTTVYGLDGFGIKLSDAAKLFAKKYAGGAAVTKTPTEKEQIDVQVRVGLVSSVSLPVVRLGTRHHFAEPSNRPLNAVGVRRRDLRVAWTACDLAKERLGNWALTTKFDPAAAGRLAGRDARLHLKVLW